MNTEVSNQLILDEYRTAIESGLNDEQAMHYCLFMLEFKPSTFTSRDYYADTWINRFKNGEAIAYADYHCRRQLVSTYVVMVEHGGLINNFLYYRGE